MDWYCAVWNSNEINNEMKAQIVYEKLCEGESYLVSESENLKGFYEDIKKEIYLSKVDKGEGYVIISCDFGNASLISDLVQDKAKTYGLCFYDPQNIIYIQYK